MRRGIRATNPARESERENAPSTCYSADVLRDRSRTHVEFHLHRRARPRLDCHSESPHFGRSMGTTASETGQRSAERRQWAHPGHRVAVRRHPSSPPIVKFPRGKPSGAVARWRSPGIERSRREQLPSRSANRRRRAANISGAKTRRTRQLRARAQAGLGGSRRSSSRLPGMKMELDEEQRAAPISMLAMTAPSQSIS